MAYGDPIPQEFNHDLVSTANFEYRCVRCETEGTRAYLYGKHCIPKDTTKVIPGDTTDPRISVVTTSTKKRSLW